MVVEGDGASREVQLEAGADQADLVIACTGADELNLLCCLIGKKLGARHTIARVRNPMYVEAVSYTHLHRLQLHRPLPAQADSIEPVS